MSRDAFALCGPQYDVVFYCMHTCAPSIMSPVLAAPEDLDTGLSRFFSRNLHRDFEKTLFEELAAVDFDVLVCDFVEERYNLLRSGEAVVSDSWALSLSPAGANLRSQMEIVDRASLAPEAFADRVEAMAARLAAIAGDRPLVLNHVALASTFERNGRIERFPSAWVDPINRRLEAYGEAFRRGAPSTHLIDTTQDGFRADYEHRWRCEPFHYEMGFYRHVIGSLSALLFEDLPVRVLSSYERWWPKWADQLSEAFAESYDAYLAGEHEAARCAFARRARERPLTPEESHYYGRTLQALDGPPAAALHLLTLAAEGQAAEEKWVQVFLARAHLDLGLHAEALAALRAAVKIAAGEGDEAVAFYVREALRRLLADAAAPAAARDEATVLEADLGAGLRSIGLAP